MPSHDLRSDQGVAGGWWPWNASWRQAIPVICDQCGKKGPIEWFLANPECEGA